MTKRIFRSIFLVAMAVLLASLLLILGVLYDYYSGLQEEELRTELALARDGLELGGAEYLESVDSGNRRLTWISPTGEVLYDSRRDAESMENHAGRQEVMEALESGAGVSTRYSETLTEQTLYYAERMQDGTVLRISVSRATVLTLVLAMLQPAAIVIVVAVALSGILASRLAKRIVRPLEAIDLDKPLESDAYDELAPVLTRVEQQHRQIQRQLQELQERENAFLAVVGNMREGLVLLGKKGTILSMNPAAASFFEAEGDCSGKDFLTVERDMTLNRMLERAETSGSGELQLSRNGREYQLNASCVEADGKASGVVLLILDVTEKVQAERSRREFTANVSHELKTPLQSIMGSAELLEQGLVKSEDIPQFTGRIRCEAARLVTLIEDIIRLSQLDEGMDLPLETVDLYALTEEELGTLENVAGERHVTLKLTGEHITLHVVRQLIQEVIYNLCDNAIKYNVEGGSVTVTIKSVKSRTVIEVSDTGIGIPLEDQVRIFERFYRVDKSRSRKIGGTGLGLSIVKHAVQSMNGTIDVQSSPGNGTTITVSLPTVDRVS